MPFTREDFKYKNHLRMQFKISQKDFDKRFRFYKREFSNKNEKTLNELALSRSPNIWDKIKKLNCPPQKISS